MYAFCGHIIGLISAVPSEKILKKYVFLWPTIDHHHHTHIHAHTRTYTHMHSIHAHAHFPYTYTHPQRHTDCATSTSTHTQRLIISRANERSTQKSPKHVRHRVFLFFDHIEQTWMCDCRSVIRRSIFGPHKLGTPSRYVSSDAKALFSYCGTSQRDQRRRRSGARERHKWWEEVPQSSLIRRSYETLTSTHL